MRDKSEKTGVTLRMKRDSNVNQFVNTITQPKARITKAFSQCLFKSVRLMQTAAHATNFNMSELYGASELVA